MSETSEEYEQNMLKDMFVRQETFQHFVRNFPIKNEQDRQKFINMQSLALVVEIGEALQETAWKDWKINQEFNMKNFKTEIVDCWHFLINITLTVMTYEELYKEFLKKNQINFDRQKEEY